MYCSECKLRVADDNVVVCPVCQGPLQSESEVEEKPETIDFAGELEDALHHGQGQEVDFGDKLDAYVRDDANLDFDPQVLGLRSSETEAAAASEDDIRVLADLWEKEDIGADLDGVFADAFNLEEVAPESAPDEAVVTKPEKTVPESPAMSSRVMSTPVMSTSAPVEKSRNLGIPLLILIVLLIAGGGGWFYMQKAGSKTPAPAQVKPQIKPRLEPAVVENKPSADKVTPVTESRVIAQSQPAADVIAATSADNNSDSATVAEPQTAPVKAEVVAAGSRAVVEKAVEPAAEKVESLPLPVKEKAVAEPEKVDLSASPDVAATTPRYVVHIGSFRSEAGAARQLAKLQKKGFAAYKIGVDLGAKGVWQRIFVPGGESKSTALKVRAELAESFPREESLIRKLKK